MRATRSAESALSSTARRRPFSVLFSGMGLDSCRRGGGAGRGSGPLIGTVGDLGLMISDAQSIDDIVDVLAAVPCHDLKTEAGAALGHGRIFDEVGDDAERRQFGGDEPGQ